MSKLITQSGPAYQLHTTTPRQAAISGKRLAGCRWIEGDRKWERTV